MLVKNATLMERGVTLFAEAKSNLWQRVEISDGVEVAEQSIAKLYEPNAVLPKRLWRRITDMECEMLSLSKETIHLSDKIAVVKLPEEVESQGRELRLEAPSTLDDLKYNPSRYREFLLRLESFYAAHELTSARREVIGFNLGLQNQFTTTIDWNKKLKTGLHIDSWDDIPLHKTGHARNRICFNFSAESRYLLFVNLSVTKIVKKLFHVVDRVDQVQRFQLPKMFFNSFPDYPVIRLKINPYEAYIAPTENLIHDGSTLGNNKPDVTYTVLGDFAIN